MTKRRTAPRSLVAHGIVEYVAGAAFLLAPWVLSFSDDTAVVLARVVGVVILLVAFASEGFPTSVLAIVPPAGHVILDYLLAVFLIAAPWLFGFTGDDSAKWWFVTLGVLHLIVTFFTTQFPMGSHVVGALAEGTSTHIEAGDHTSADR